MMFINKYNNRFTRVVALTNKRNDYVNRGRELTSMTHTFYYMPY